MVPAGVDVPVDLVDLSAGVGAPLEEPVDRLPRVLLVGRCLLRLRGK